MLIIKKINNNVALAQADDGSDLVVFGKGVGFPATPYELEDTSSIQTVFHHVDNEVLTAASSIKPEVMASAVEIANLAAKTLDCDLNRNLFLTLADHLQFAIERTEDGAYTVLYTIADGLFYFLPVMLAITAARKFKMSEFTALGIGVALVYPTMVALTGGDVLGSIDLGFFGTFSWYATFPGIPIIMPASGYTSSVIPVLLMADMKVGTWGGAG